MPKVVKDSSSVPIRGLSWRQREYRLWGLLFPACLLLAAITAYRTGSFPAILKGNPFPEPVDGDRVDTRLAPGPIESPLEQLPEATLQMEPARGSSPARHQLTQLAGLDFSILDDDAIFSLAERDLWHATLAQLESTNDKDLHDASLGNVGLAQLFGQSEVYRGRIIAVSGEIRRLEDGKDVCSGTTRYPSFRCWIRPDSANDPLAVDFLELPRELSSLVGQEISGPRVRKVHLEGVFFKRLAYRSQSGPRVVPLVLARGIHVEPRAVVAALDNPWAWLPAVCGIGGLFGICLVWLILWQTKRRRAPPAGIRRILFLAVMSMTLGTCDCLAQEPPKLEDYLDLLDYTPSDWEAIGAGTESSPDGLRRIQEIADLLARVPSPTIAAWVQAFRTSPPQPGNQGRPVLAMIREHGRIRRIRPVTFDPTQHEPKATGTNQHAPREAFWECFLETESTPPEELKCWIRDIPSAWKAIVSPTSIELAEASTAPNQPFPAWREFDQHVAVSGLLVSTGNSSGAALTRVVIAPKLEWYPRHPVPNLGVSESLCLLAGAGVDLTSLAGVSSRGPLGDDDRTPFYQILAAVRKVSDEDLARVRKVDHPLSSLLQDGSRYRGEIFTYAGTARRAVEIHVDAEDVQMTWGIDKYYEVEVFVEPDVNIQVVHPETGETKAFGRYPLVFCCREWPSAAPRGDTIHVPVSITGVYLKQWTYRSKFKDEGWRDGGNRVQWSPLLIANRVRILEPDRTESDRLGYLIGGTLAVCLGLIVLSAIIMSLPHPKKRS